MDAPRVDSHLHIWDLGRSRYSWLTPEHEALYRNFTPEEAASELTRNGFDGAIVVQADDSRSETEYLLQVAENSSWVFGVVGWIELDNPQRAAADLERWQENPVFRGVRHLVHSDPRKDFLDRPTVHASLHELGRLGYTLDIPDAWPAHCDQAYRLARANENLTVVIDHLAKPPQSAAEFLAWRHAIQKLAELPNTVTKLSGLRSPELDFTPQTLAPAWKVALDAFGPDRIMYGGDWPMTTPYGNYSDTWRVVSQLLADVSAEERNQILGLTAFRVYRLGVPRNTTTTTPQSHNVPSYRND